MQLFSSWTGGDFLVFYIGLLAFCSLAAWWIPANLREPGRPGGPLEPEDLALLAGGRQRHADSVIADLFARGGLISVDSGKLMPDRADLPATPAGKALMAQREPFTPIKASQLMSVHADRIAARLRREGLMLRPEDSARLRWLSIIPFGVLFMIGLYRQRAGSALGEPTGFLVILLGLTVVLAVMRLANSDPRTRAGIAAVQAQHAKASRLRRAPQPEEAALAVALFGTAVLVGTPWEPVHAMRQPASGDSGGSSDSGGDSSSDSSDGGSGCGGGGCGGCGG
jgi:uncharacterized protein (TIGR04222 family)